MSNSDWMVVECEEGHPRFVNGQEIPNWQQGPKILVAIQHLGGKGWEMIWARSTLWLGYGKLTFIRQKSLDYLFMVCEDGRPRYVNDQEIPNWQQGPTVLSAVSHLSLKGWELVSGYPDLQLGSGKLIFRRLKKMRYL